MKKTRLITLVILLVLVLALVTVGCVKPNQPVEKTEYDVTYLAGEGATGTIAGAKYEEGTKFNLPEATGLSKEGYEFSKWNDGTADYAAGAEYTMPANAVTFTAVWTEVVVKHTVTFNPNNADEPTTWTEAVVDGETVAAPAENPVHPDGKHFRYWANEENEAYDFTAAVTEDITLWAIYAWEITFDVNGAEGSVDSVWVRTWNARGIELPSADGLTNEGKVFAGWTDGETTYEAGEYFAGTADHTLTAVWVVAGSRTVSFETEERGIGDDPETLTVNFKDVITLPANPYELNEEGLEWDEHYLFVGWYVAGGDESKLYQPDAKYTVKDDVTFCAKWERAYRISLSAGLYGSDFMVIDVVAGECDLSKLISEWKPYDDSYIPNGWFYFNNYGEKVLLEDIIDVTEELNHRQLNRNYLIPTIYTDNANLATLSIYISENGGAGTLTIGEDTYVVDYELDGTACTMNIFTQANLNDPLYTAKGTLQGEALNITLEMGENTYVFASTVITLKPGNFASGDERYVFCKENTLYLSDLESETSYWDKDLDAELKGWLIEGTDTLLDPYGELELTGDVVLVAQYTKYMRFADKGNQVSLALEEGEENGTLTNYAAWTEYSLTYTLEGEDITLYINVDGETVEATGTLVEDLILGNQLNAGIIINGSEYVFGDATPTITYTVTFQPGDHATGEDIVINDVVGEFKFEDVNCDSWVVESGYIFNGWLDVNTYTLYTAEESKYIGSNVTFVADFSKAHAQMDTSSYAYIVLGLEDPYGIGYTGSLKIYNEDGSYVEYFVTFELLENDGISVYAMDEDYNSYSATGTLNEYGLALTITIEDVEYVFEQTLPPVPPTAKFDANDGEGAAPECEFKETSNGYSLVLPACSYTAPAGYEFDRWEITNGTRVDTRTAGSTYIAFANEELVIKPLWKAVEVPPTPAFEGVTFTGSASIKGFQGAVTTVEKIVLNKDELKIEYTLADGTSKVVAITVESNEMYKPSDLGEDALYYETKINNIAVYLLVKSDLTKMAFCDQNENLIEGSELLAEGTVVPTPTYTVTFDPNNEENLTTVTVEAGSTVAAPAENPVHPNGKTFRYWRTEAGDVYDFTTPVTADIELTAIYEWEVSFDVNGAEGTVQSIWTRMWTPAGVVLPGADGLTNGDKVFGGWTDGTTTYAAGDRFVGDANHTLTAVWNDLVVKYTVTFDPNNEENLTTVTVEAGSTVAQPENPVHPNGKTFRYWRTEEGNAYDFTTPVTANIELTAYYAYEVSFDVNGAEGTIESIWVTVWTRGVELPSADVLKNGDKVFGGWTDGTTTYAAGEWFRGTGSHTLIAVWNDPIVKYTVSFTTNYQGEGTAPESSTVDANTSIELPVNPFTAKVGYTNFAFVGWYASTDSSVLYQAGDSYVVTGNVEFKAKWEKQNYTLTLLPGEGAEGEAITKTVSGSVSWYSIDTSSWTTTIYVLAGWKVEGTDTVLTSEDKLFVDHDVTLTAQWLAPKTYCTSDYSAALLLYKASETTGSGYVTTDFDTLEASFYVSYELSGETISMVIYPLDYSELLASATGIYNERGLGITFTVNGATYTFELAPLPPTVTFDANGGEGDAPKCAFEETSNGYRLVLPACSYTAPAGYEFDKWEITNGDNVSTRNAGLSYFAQAGEEVVIKPLWKEIPPVVVTVAQALELANGTKIIVTGVVTEVNEDWGSFNNMCVTITDEAGDSLYIFRLATQVGLGDTITVTGAMTTFSNARQIGAGATATIDAPHVCAEWTEADCNNAGKCVLCGKENAEMPALGHVDADEDGLCDRCNANLNVTTSEVSIITYATGGTMSADGKSISWSSDKLTVTNYQNNSTNAIRTSDSNHFRCYQGSKLVISANSDETIVKVVITCQSVVYANIFSTSLTTEGATVVVDGSSVIVTLSGSSVEFVLSAQSRITEVAITYVA